LIGAKSDEPAVLTADKMQLIVDRLRLQHFQLSAKTDDLSKLAGPFLAILDLINTTSK